ncbi:MAG TPA: CoA transferase [Dehalococcoidia bacterium]|nr:CoA transferase [Dehalococcoidia bacterium]
MAKLPLEGIRVLDLTRAYAGTIGTMYLADLGAEVIKVEAVTRPDIPTREINFAELDPGDLPWERAAYFHRLNVGKRDITLDLTSETGIELFRKLVLHCDVVAENYNAATMRRFGLHYEALKELNPGIIMASMSGFGAEGPRRLWAAYYPAMESMAGLTAITGYDDGELVQSSTGYGDWILGTAGALSIISALHYRERTGKGQYIDVSGREAALATIGEAMIDLTMNSREWGPVENRDSSMAPHDVYKCKDDGAEDRWVAIAVRGESDWGAFCNVLDSPAWTNEDRFSDTLKRWENQDEMRPLIEEWTSQRSHWEAAQALLDAGVPAGPVLDPREMLFDEHLRARDYFEVIDHPVVGARIFPRQVPAHYSSIPRQARSHTPTLGEHNREVLGGVLGLSDAELNVLEEEGAIGTRPKRESRRPPPIPPSELRKRGAVVDEDYREKLSSEYGQRIGPPE